MGPDTVVLAAGDVSVEILPDVGGRVHRIAVAGHDLLRTPPQPDAAKDDPFFWSSFVMAPWCNRVPAARLLTADGPVTLHPNWVDGSALHGEVYARPWRHLGDGRLQVAGGGSDFPWSYTVRAEVRVDPAGMSYDLTLTNEGTTAMPAGLGWHPWFRADGGSLQLRAAPGRRYPLDPGYIPAGDPEPLSSGDYDPSCGGPLPWGAHELYTQLAERTVTLHWPSRDLWGVLSFSADADHLIMYAHEPADAVAVEPQTHAIDGHRRAVLGLSGGVRLLGPGEALSVRYRLSVSLGSPPPQRPRTDGTATLPDPEDRHDP